MKINYTYSFIPNVFSESNFQFETLQISKFDSSRSLASVQNKQDIVARKIFLKIWKMLVPMLNHFE